MVEVCAREHCVYNPDGGNVSYFGERRCLFQRPESVCHAAKHLLLERKIKERAEVRREVEGDSLGKRQDRKWTETERQA